MRPRSRAPLARLAATLLARAALARAPLARLAPAALAVALAASLVPPAVGPAAASDGGFRLDLLERGDFVTQYTDVACVGASVQTMLNIVRDGADRSRSTQAQALKTAQRQSNPVFVRRSGGASAIGWAYALERLGAGPYRVRSFATRAAALRAVATAIRATGRPAGLLVWRGAHAWVASGFRASADPATAPSFRVDHLVVSDPWWPRPTGGRGRTLPPGSELSPKALARHFVPFQRGPKRGGSVLNGGVVVVLPIDPAVVEARAADLL
jgi:hypothetical protein